MERGYNARGYLETLTDATTATRKTLVRYGAMDAYGNIEEETFGNRAETVRTYDAKTGRAKTISTTLGTLTFQNHAYAWRTDGSLESRTANAAGSGTSARALREEEFGYDYLGRLVSAATNLGDASRTLDYDYHRNGNLTSKTSDVTGDKNVTATMYGQGTAGPHALTRATVGGVVHDFRYDAQGHIERYDAASGDDRFIEWDGRGLAMKVTVGTAKDAEKPTARETFLYGPGGARYRKTSEWRVGAGDAAVLKSETTHYVGAYEKRTRACTTGEGDSEEESTESVERTRVGPVLHVNRYACGSTEASASEIEYRHFDHLGSTGSVTSAAGAELVALAHDPHGERRKPDWTRRLNEAEIDALGSDHGDRTSRGFTGHEHLDRTGLVHMNGRLYDPLLGRFLSPDPIVANPGHGQQWNLYSYAMNSPLSYIDPSGLSWCDPAQQSWCNGVGVPGSGRGGGYGTRTVSGWGTYVTFGIYHQIVRIWRSSSSFSSWGGGDYDGGWSDDIFWEDVQRTVIYPIVHWFRWALQVVEQSVAAEPASSHSPEKSMGTVLGDGEDPAQQAVNRRIFPSPDKILKNYPDPLSDHCEQAERNECAVRMSIALHGARVDISTGPEMKGKTHPHGDVTIQMGARVLADYLSEALGPPQKLERSGQWTIEDFKTRQGIIYLPNSDRGGDASTEHIDVISGGVAGSRFYPNKMVWIWEYKDGKYVDPR